MIVVLYMDVCVCLCVCICVYLALVLAFSYKKKCQSIFGDSLYIFFSPSSCMIFFFISLQKYSAALNLLSCKRRKFISIKGFMFKLMDVYFMSFTH